MGLDYCGTDVPYDEAYQHGMFERHPGCGCVITSKSKKGYSGRGKAIGEPTTGIRYGKKKSVRNGLEEMKVSKHDPHGI